jgi:hypothetical protein
MEPTDIGLVELGERAVEVPALVVRVGAYCCVTVEESELLRAMADAIERPMPPLIGDREPDPPSDTMARHCDRG